MLFKISSSAPNTCLHTGQEHICSRGKSFIVPCVIRYFRVVSRSMIARPGNKLISSGKRHNLRHASRALIRHTRHRRKGSKNHCVFWNTILNIGRCSKIGHRTLERRTVEKRGGNSDIVCIRPRGLKSFCVFYNVTMLSTNQTEKSH